MSPIRKLALVAFLGAPALAMAQAPIVPLTAETTPAIIRAQAPMQMPMAPMAIPAKPVEVPKVEKPAAEEPKAEEPKAEEKFLLQKLMESSPAGKTLADNGWKISGWTQGSYNASTARKSNLPVPFIDRANAFVMNQNWLHVEKSIDTEKKEFQIGGTMEAILPGTDSRLTYARGLLDRQNARNIQYGIDIYQGYVDFFAPNALGPNGTTFRVGKFATHCEYEVVQGTQNPFVSRSYNFQYNPFTHTGVQAITPLNDDWTVSNAIVLGNDNFLGTTARPTYLGQLKWAPKEGKSSLAFSASVTNPAFDVGQQFNYYNVYNLILTHKFTDKLTYVLDTTFSHENNIPGVGDAHWYGFANYLLYQMCDNVALNTRLEFFNDAQGVRTGASGLYTALTVGATYKPTPWLYLMPEVRYDHKSGGQGGPFEGQSNLFTAAMGAIVRW